jgi:hypothetical protein
LIDTFLIFFITALLLLLLVIISIVSIILSIALIVFNKMVNLACGRIVPKLLEYARKVGFLYVFSASLLTHPVVPMKQSPVVWLLKLTRVRVVLLPGLPLNFSKSRFNVPLIAPLVVCLKFHINLWRFRLGYLLLIIRGG